jgi:hypothetical protein
MTQLVQILKSKGILPKGKEACFTFDLSFRATEVTADNEFEESTRNELMRVDWSTKLQDELVDPR